MITKNSLPRQAVRLICERATKQQVPSWIGYVPTVSVAVLFRCLVGSRVQDSRKHPRCSLYPSFLPLC